MVPNENFDLDDLEVQSRNESLNKDLTEMISKKWKLAKVEPLRDSKNAHITCLLLDEERPIAQMDFTAPIDRLHEVFSWNHENLRKFIQEFI